MSYIGEQPRFSDYPSQLFSPNGTDTTFAMGYGVGTPASVIVCISGVKQSVGSYAVTNSTLDFGAGNPPPSGTNTLEIVYLGLKADPSPIQDQTLGIDAIMRTNAQSITENMSVASTVNAMSCGPITIADTKVVTVLGYWTVV